MKWSEQDGAGGAPLWVSGTGYLQNDVLRSPADWQLYVRITNGAGTTDPSSDGTNFLPAGARPSKPVQRGVIRINNSSTPVSSASATISAVNPLKTRLRFEGSTGFGSSEGPRFMGYVTLVNATTIAAVRGTAEAASADTYVSWELEEWY